MKFTKFILLAPILIIVFSLCVFAQDDTIRVNTNLVTLNVAVTDKNGNYVKGLKAEDFELFDQGKEQEIENFSAEEASVSFGIIYDLHSTTNERTANVLEALRQFTKDLKPKDYFFVTAFNERGSLTTEFVPTSDQINQNLTDAKPTTPNSLYDAIFAASKQIRERKNSKQVLLLLTDGEDKSSDHSLKELRIHLRSVNLPVYSIVFGNENQRLFSYYDLNRTQGRQTLGALESSQLNTAALAEISKTSGGKTFERQIQNRIFLNAIFKKVQAEVENQYVIGFYPDKLDRKWHKLKVSLKSPNAKKSKLSNRKGYLSP